MKKLTALLLAFALVLCAVSSLAEGNVFTTKYYTLTLPDTWDIGTDPIEDDGDELSEELGYFYDATNTIGLTVETYIVFFEEMKTTSLWDADEATLKDYTDMLLEELADDRPASVGTLLAGKIPFILIRGTDDYGDYLYAETMTNGYAIIFEAVVTDPDGMKVYPLTDEHIDQLKNILLTFAPVT